MLLKVTRFASEQLNREHECILLKDVLKTLTLNTSNAYLDTYKGTHIMCIHNPAHIHFNEMCGI